MTQQWELMFLGNGYWRATAHRGFPALRLAASGLTILVDCGDGVLDRLLVNGGAHADVVLLTTSSVVNITGLLMLAETQRAERQKPLRVTGPIGTVERVSQLARLASVPQGLFSLEELQPGDIVPDVGKLYIEAVRTEVPEVPCLSYVVVEPPLQGRVNVEEAARLGIAGADFARLISGQNVRGVRPKDIIGPPRAGRRVFVNGRGRPTHEMVEALEGADVAVFAAPFMDERLEVAEDMGYMTGWEAANLSTERRVRTVMLYQLTPPAPAFVHVNEARQFHRSVHAPKPGQMVRIPTPDDGAPSLVPGILQGRRSSA